MSDGRTEADRRAEAWDAFWSVAARVLNEQARRASQLEQVTEADRLRIDNCVRRCDRGLRECRAANRDLRSLLGPDLAVHDLERLEMALRQVTVAFRSVKAAWRDLRPPDCRPG